jgi:hypothetical protein
VGKKASVAGTLSVMLCMPNVGFLFRSDILMKRQNHFSFKSLSFFLLLPTGDGLQIAASPLVAS